jgi:hypothetical protein
MRLRVGFVLVVLALTISTPILTGQARPRGIYVAVSLVDEISALETANPSATQKELDEGFSQFYQGLLENTAVAGLALQVHWDTVNPNFPGGAEEPYFWNYVDDAFREAKAWNDDNPGVTPKTIQLILMPGFQSPLWLTQDLMSSCNGLFHSPRPIEPASDCGTVTFTGFSEPQDSTTFPLPWNSTYKLAWRLFLKEVAGRYGSNPLLVSVAVAGPTAASTEMIVPNNANSDPKQYPDNAAISPSEMWLRLLDFHYKNRPEYQGTDKAFIDEWEDAIDTYSKIFHGITLIVTTGNGFPNFVGAPKMVPPLLEKDCEEDKNPDCAAEATILAYFMQPTVGGDNAKASQTSGMVASHEVANMNDMGVPGVKQLSQLTETETSASTQVLGGSQFSAKYSSGVLKEGCTETFPPKPTGSLPAGCSAATLAMCLDTKMDACIPVACIPAACLAPGVTPDSIAKFGTYGKVPAKDLISAEQGLYNVLSFFFEGTESAPVFGGTVGTAPAPMNFMQIYSEDIQYATDNMNLPGKVVEGGETTEVTAQSLLDSASAQLLSIGEPPPSISSAGLVFVACRPGQKLSKCEWVAINGSNLATGVANAPEMSPTQLAGTSVTINGNAANILTVSPTQITVQVPSGLAHGQEVVVTTEFGSATGKIQ